MAGLTIRLMTGLRLVGGLVEVVLEVDAAFQLGVAGLLER